MSYKVLIALEVKKAIASWQLPRDLLMQVYHRLNTDLPASPDALLGERVVPLAAFSFTFTLEQGNWFPPLHHFLFVVDRLDDQHELRIIGCRHTQEGLGTN